MTTTLEYCPKCSDRLSWIAPRTEDETKFYWASLRRLGSITRQGTCAHCGREDAVTSYTMRDWST